MGTNVSNINYLFFILFSLFYSLYSILFILFSLFYSLYSILFILFYMSFLYIVLGVILVVGLFKGIKNGLFVELASLISLILGIYIAIKFSFLARIMLSGFVHWNPKTIQIIAFIVTFPVVVVAISLLAKFLTSVANFAKLGVINQFGG